MKASLFLVIALLCGCASATRQPVTPPRSEERSAFLADVPHRIETFKRTYARDYPLTSEKFWLWDYAHFLEVLLRDVNRQIGDGDTLSEEHLRSIATFADVQTVSSKWYVYPMWRGASGYDATYARNVVHRFEEVLRGLVPSMGHALSTYYPDAKDWDDATIKAWLERFDSAATLDALYGKEPNQ